MYNIITVIIANSHEYLKESIDSALNPLIIYDGIEPLDSDGPIIQCNSGRSSIAKNLALTKVNKSPETFIQFLDCDDFLAPNYYDVMQPIIENNPDYDLFYSDYSIKNEDYNFINREYIGSIGPEFKRENFYKIRNPLIRSTVFNSHRFNDNISSFEYIDLITKIKINKCYHVPKDLQAVRLHAKSPSRLLNKEEALRSFGLIDWTNING